MIVQRVLMYLCAALLVACVTLTALWQYQVGRTNHYAAAYAKAEAKAQLEAREAERRHAQQMQAAAAQYEQDRRKNEDAERKLVADLRAGNERLQNRWAGCVSEAGRSAAERDAAARDREESAARIVRAAADADAQIRALQDVIRKDRGQ